MNVIVAIIIIGLLYLFYRLGRRVSEEEIDILHTTAIRQAGQIEILGAELDRLSKIRGGIR